MPDRLDILQLPGSLLGQRPDASQLFAQLTEPADGVPGGTERRGVRRRSGPERRLALTRLGELPLGGGDLASNGGLGLPFGEQLGARLEQVVGEQPQPGIAHRGLHDTGLAGGLGLPAERAELAAQLCGEVGDPGEVGRHRLQLAQRLFLALAVLQHAGSFLDETAAVFGPGAEDGVELALAHHHVQLAADTGVAHQFLHIEQPAGRAVDRVLALTAAEHQPADRHLGVVDRQRAVTVVDGELHLGTAERRPVRRAGEDHVRHGAAAQRLGTLLAEDPRDGVDDVALAGAVGPTTQVRPGSK